MPVELDATVFWLMIGRSDLTRGRCSEEATVAGILNVAKEIHRLFPVAVVVIQGILPTANCVDNPDRLLVPHPYSKKLFGKHHSERYYAQQAQHAFGLWPSIQSINHELEVFCKRNEYFVYFDAAALFLRTIRDGNWAGPIRL